jgi:hypothetical protein
MATIADTHAYAAPGVLLSRWASPPPHRRSKRSPACGRSSSSPGTDADQYERWRRPDFVVDLSPGPAEGFSLGPADQHFVTKGPR